MSLAEVMTGVRELSREEKLRLIQMLAAELADAEQPARLEAGKSYPVWSPHDSHEAASVLLEVLQRESARP